MGDAWGPGMGGRGGEWGGKGGEGRREAGRGADGGGLERTLAVSFQDVHEAGESPPRRRKLTQGVRCRARATRTHEQRPDDRVLEKKIWKMPPGEGGGGTGGEEGVEGTWGGYGRKRTLMEHTRRPRRRCGPVTCINARL